MKNYATCHLVSEERIVQHFEPCSIHEFEAKDLKDAKEQMMRICENHEVMSDWCKGDPTSEWEDAPFDDSETLLARRIFKEKTQHPTQEPRELHVELRNVI